MQTRTSNVQKDMQDMQKKYVKYAVYVNHFPICKNYANYAPGTLLMAWAGDTGSDQGHPARVLVYFSGVRGGREGSALLGPAEAPRLRRPAAVTRSLAESI